MTKERFVLINWRLPSMGSGSSRCMKVCSLFMKEAKVSFWPRYCSTSVRCFSVVERKCSWIRLAFLEGNSFRIVNQSSDLWSIANICWDSFSCTGYLTSWLLRTSVHLKRQLSSFLGPKLEEIYCQDNFGCFNFMSISI